MKIHIVKQGESFYLIGQKYGVTVEELKKLNPSVTDDLNLQIGSKIKVPSHAHVEKPGSHGLIHKYTVKSGDTLWKLSKAWGVPLNDLIKANPQLANPDVLNIGDIVNIPKQEGVHGLPVESDVEHHHHHHHHHHHDGGKTFTGPIVDGKANTGVVPPVEKPPEAVKPVIPPAPPLPPVEEKISLKLLYGEKTVHPFAQEKIPAVEAISPLYELPKMPKTYGGYGKTAHESMHGHGGSYSSHGLGGASATPYSGYGHKLPGVGGASAMPYSGYGHEMPGVGGVSAMPYSGYGHEMPGVGGASAMPYSGYGHEMPGVGGVSAMPYSGGYGHEMPGVGGVSAMPYSGGYGHEMPGVGGVSAMPYSGYGHEMPGVGGASAMPYSGYGHSAVSPAAVGPHPGGYGSWPGAVSPAAAGYPWAHQPTPYPGGMVQGAAEMPGHYSGYGHYGQTAGVSAHNPYSAHGYGTGVMPAAEAALPGHMGSYSYGGGGQWNPTAVSPATAWPAHPAQPGWMPGAPAAYPAANGYGMPGAWPQQTAGIQGHGAMPGYPVAAPVQPVNATAEGPCGGCGDREGEEAVKAEDEQAKPESKEKAAVKPAKTGTAVAARKPAKKAVIRSTARPAARQSRGSRPWINR